MRCWPDCRGCAHSQSKGHLQTAQTSPTNAGTVHGAWEVSTLEVILTDLFVSSVGLGSRGRDPAAVSFRTSSAVSPLTWLQFAEGRRVRAAELFGQGRSGAEIARMLGVSDESVRRWKRAWDKDGAGGLRRRPATGRPPKWMGCPGRAGAGGARTGHPGACLRRQACGPWNDSVRSSCGDGVMMSTASVWRLLTARLG
ncbi:helix-turn-helix domain-containing protein [Streptomyces sp. NPDC004787]|uniref:helix-turn-helix domain-containing protein n=1 Tax=Streptomyces sp. NPDC004787 TaxID=3154291 RepID=UPI0033B3804A